MAGKSAQGGRLPYPISMPLSGGNFQLWNAFHNRVIRPGLPAGHVFGGGVARFLRSTAPGRALRPNQAQPAHI